MSAAQDAWEGPRPARAAACACDGGAGTPGDLAAALGRVTATYVLPISTDLFLPVEHCAAEQALVPGGELRVVEDVHGHGSLSALDPVPGYLPQVDAALGELLATPV